MLFKKIMAQTYHPRVRPQILGVNSPHEPYWSVSSRSEISNMYQLIKFGFGSVPPRAHRAKKKYNGNNRKRRKKWVKLPNCPFIPWRYSGLLWSYDGVSSEKVPPTWTLEVVSWFVLPSIMPSFFTHFNAIFASEGHWGLSHHNQHFFQFARKNHLKPKFFPEKPRKSNMFIALSVWILHLFSQNNRFHSQL